MYRETLPPAALRGLVECAWSTTGGAGGRVLPDGCMDLLLSPDGTVSVAGPDTAAFVVTGAAEWTAGVRFHPGALPRVLGVPASELRDRRESLAAVAPAGFSQLTQDLSSAHGCAATAPTALLGATARLVAGATETRETAPWTVDTLAHVTARLAQAARVEELADELGWSPRSLTRHCTAVYGYGPAVLRRILRFRAAAALLHAGIAPAEVAARTGYSDQPHLTREATALAGVPPSVLAVPHPA